MPEETVMTQVEPASVNNQDIAMLQPWINRTINELLGCQSSQVTAWKKADIDRLKSFVGKLVDLHKWVMGQPELDNPESHPTAFTLRENPAVPNVQNEGINALVRMLETMRAELTKSQSARLSCKLLKADSARLEATLDKIGKYIEDTITPGQEVDMPESTPNSGEE